MRLNARTRTESNMSSRQVERILQEGGYINTRGVVMWANGVCQGHVSNDFTEYYDVSYSEELNGFYASDLKASLEMEQRLKKLLTGG